MHARDHHNDCRLQLLPLLRADLLAHTSRLGWLIFGGCGAANHNYRNVAPEMSFNPIRTEKPRLTRLHILVTPRLPTFGWEPGRPLGAYYRQNVKLVEVARLTRRIKCVLEVQGVDVYTQRLLFMLRQWSEKRERRVRTGAYEQSRQIKDSVTYLFNNLIKITFLRQDTPTPPYNPVPVRHETGAFRWTAFENLEYVPNVFKS